MSIENTNFKVGDRVRYIVEVEDYGTVMPDDVGNDRGAGLASPDSIWVKWESDGKILQARSTNMELVCSQQVPSAFAIHNCSELTVQTCLDFLISQGYTVSLSKN